MGTYQVGNPGLNLYLLFVVSWLLHLPARVAALGVVRFDLMLVGVLTVMAISGRRSAPTTSIDWILRILVLYSVLSIPFVEWPGTVIKTGLPNLIKAILFYYFTAAFVRSEADVRRFVLVFVTCQVLRVAEPLYLHITTGYWGSSASLSGGAEFMYRLAGGPYDVLNPNGLAFVVCTTLPFLYFLSSLSWSRRAGALLLTPALLYALVLTGSRSGMIGVLVVFVGVIVKSRRRALLVATGIVVAATSFAFMSQDMQDRYLSTFGKGEKNAATAQERIEGMTEQYNVVLHKPLFGHGLGTSAEANYHFTSAGPYGGRDLPAHNIYLEVAQELGLIGLVIFLVFIGSMVKRLLVLRRDISGAQLRPYISRLVDAMQVWIFMNIVFSFASYGLSSFDWYLFGGLSVVVQRILGRLTAGDFRHGSAQQSRPAVA